ncbi:IMPACT family protein [Portibacter lacus]|uniref:Impact N-terminal domain-containing protein n=1 Tax=Portibacter lacus TaxID=1099794 RepID=A0AA37SL19_9BACT|nr:YigZ family protein [Portibacter lacus]GLR15484.1 hypothetical protein GCM10007940_00990 [Portibacter lacus]
MIDHYHTIKSEAEALLKEKSSKFYAYAYPVASTDDIEECLNNLKKSHLKARHYCYAYILGADKLMFRANDDGEPSGTAGRPIMGQLEKRNLTNTLVVVVRYFGGTKLGTSGLIKAYKESAAMALDQAQIIEEFITGYITITSSYEEVGKVMNIVSSLNLSITDTTYEADAKIKVKLRLSEIAPMVYQLKAKFLNRSIEDITEETEVENITFTVHDE